MRKKINVFLVIGILGITISAGFIGLFAYNLLTIDEPVESFNLDDAPGYIIEMKTELKEKFENYNFSFEDMSNFITFSQYLADNSPSVLELVKDWNQIVLFNITNSTEDMWWFIENNALIIEFGAEFPSNPGILIELNLETFIRILRGDETPLSAFQKGDLVYVGSFNEVLDVAYITKIASATIMDNRIPVQTGLSDFTISVDKSNLREKGGLTLFPRIEVNLDPERIGEPRSASMGDRYTVIIDQYGKVIAQLENAAQTVHKFINSTTIMMGGQEGFIELWNYKKDLVETLMVPAGHHELDYNPETDTFMVIEFVHSSEIWDGRSVSYDLLSEYNRTGGLVWQWDSRIVFPFNSTRHTSLGLNETYRGAANWMHANSFSWDKSEEVIYLNLRSLDTILKINYTTKEVIWEAGREGEFTLLNKNGEVVNTLFCHPHSFERVGPNRFIIFDNDLHNITNPSTMTLNENSTGYSRYLEFEINEDDRIMRELWSWTPPNQSYYLPEAGGDADRLPDGNVLGIFGNKGFLNQRDPVILTEITRDGKVAWELQIPGINDTYYWVHRVERFYEKPLVSIHDIDLKDGTLSINFSTWNSFKQDTTSQGEMKITVNNQEIYQESLVFLPHWQPTLININIENLPTSIELIELIIENNDGIQNSVIIFQKQSNLFSLFLGNIPFILGIGIVGSVLIAIPSVFLFKKYRKRVKIAELGQELNVSIPSLEEE